MLNKTSHPVFRSGHYYAVAYVPGRYTPPGPKPGPPGFLGVFFAKAPEHPSFSFHTFALDGRWLAYSSEETGRSEVYVRSFPDGVRKWRVSTAGGVAPHWAKGGREILYQSTSSDLLAVPVMPGAEFRPGKPVTLFHADLSTYGWGVNRWAVTADGQRFLLNLAIKNPFTGFTVTKNWEAAIGSR